MKRLLSTECYKQLGETCHACTPPMPAADGLLFIQKNSMIRRSLFSKDFLTFDSCMESESRLGRMRLAYGQTQRHCSRRQDPSWPPAMETVQEERDGSQAYRVHACCMGMGLPRSASNRCRCRSQCRASVRKITNANRASRAVPAWLETTRPQMSRTRKNRLAKALRER